MQIEPTADQRAFIQEAIKSGRIRNPEDAVQQALSLWEERERLRLELMFELQIGLDELDRGEFIEITAESAKEMLEDIKNRGRERLAREPGGIVS